MRLPLLQLHVRGLEPSLDREQVLVGRHGLVVSWIATYPCDAEVVATGCVELFFTKRHFTLASYTE